MTKAPRHGNLLKALQPSGAEESVEELVSLPGIRIERILSHGHSSPEGCWYDQDDDEWVVVVDGEAELEIEGESAPRLLERGDWIFLPAHCRHRVARTQDEQPTVWLAVHMMGG
jgi:cupin 2 domain-containing protein